MLMLDALLMLLATVAFCLFFIGAIWGGGALSVQFMERFDFETQKGVLLFALLVIPVMLICVVAGPFYALLMAYRAFRKMPWS